MRFCTFFGSYNETLWRRLMKVGVLGSKLNVFGNIVLRKVLFTIKIMSKNIRLHFLGLNVKIS